MASALARLEELLGMQRLAVVSTTGEAGPYSSLVAFAAHGPGRIYFATARSTRKYSFIDASDRVAVLLDDRANSPADIAEAAAATGLGSATELDGAQRDEAASALLALHPHLRDFFLSPSVAVIAVEIECWYVVQRFQDVTSLEPRDWSP